MQERKQQFTFSKHSGLSPLFLTVWLSWPSKEDKVYMTCL